MAAAAYRPSVTPTLVLCLGDFGERVAQALISEIEAAGPAVQAAVRWLCVTWPEAGGIRLTDPTGRVLLEVDEDGTEPLTAIRGEVEEALRAIGLHATRERLLRAGYGLRDESPTSRRARCYLVAALREAPVVAALVPLLAHVNALLTSRHGPRSIAAFLNIATHRLDPDAPERATVAAALQTLPDLVPGQPLPGLWPCVLLDGVKTGDIYADEDDELSAALVALLRVLLLADEPAALLQEAFPLTSSVDGDSSTFCSLGVAVIQSPPREAVLDWLAARLMAEFLSRRCLEPLEGPREITLGNSQQVANRLQLGVLLEALAEGLDAEMTAEPGLSVLIPHGTFGQSPNTAETLITKSSRMLMDQINRNQSALRARLLSETDPVGQFPRTLAEEIARGPHGLWSAEALLAAVVEQIQMGQAVLEQKLVRWPLRHEQLAERVRQTQAMLNAARRTLPGPNALLLKSGLVAALWGCLFGTWAGRVWGAGEIAGAVLTAVLVVITMGLWYVFFKRRQIRRAQKNYITAVAALHAAQVGVACLEAARAVLDVTKTWQACQMERLHAARKLLRNVQEALAERPLELPSDPIIVETLPYLGGYAEWLRTVLHDDPLMLEVQTVLERSQILGGWPDLDEADLLQAFTEAGRQALLDVPELSVEDVLTGQGEETLKFHLERLHQLAAPLIGLDQPTIPSPAGGPSTLDISCWAQGAVARLQGWLESHLPDHASIAVTGDPQRVTYIRLVPGFDLGNLWIT